MVRQKFWLVDDSILMYSPEDSDPNRHLFGAYAVVSKHTVQSFADDLLQDGFWNYLREEIKYALTRRSCLKIRVDHTSLQLTKEADEGFANAITLILAKIINTAFDDIPWSDALSQRFTADLDEWKQQLPTHLWPYSRAYTAASIFPAIRQFRECHGNPFISYTSCTETQADIWEVAAWHYYYVSRTLIASKDLERSHEMLPSLSNELIPYLTTLEDNAIEICGLAFTSSSPSVMVNAYGPIAYCKSQCHVLLLSSLTAYRHSLATK